MLLTPLGLELGRGEIPQRRMDPLVHIDVVQKAPNLPGPLIMVCLGLAAACWSACGTVAITPSSQLVPSATRASPSMAPPATVALPSFLGIVIPGVTEPGDDIPCVGGEWQGIRPGVTSEEDLVQWLETAPVVDQDSLSTWPPYTAPNGLIVKEYGWYAGESPFPIRIAVVSDTVSSISLWLQYSLTLKRVVDELGPPDYVEAYIKMAYSDACLYDINVYYPHLGLVLYGEQNICDGFERDPMTGQLSGPLEQDVELELVFCTQPSSIVAVLQTYKLFTLEEATEYADHQLRGWTGFGRILLSEWSQ